MKSMEIEGSTKKKVYSTIMLQKFICIKVLKNSPGFKVKQNNNRKFPSLKK